MKFPGHILVLFWSFEKIPYFLFHSGCANLHSHQQWIRVPFSVEKSSQYLLFVLFLVIAILTGMRWHFTVDVISISWWYHLCICWSSIFPLWKKNIYVYLVLLLIFNLIFWFLILSLWSAYTCLIFIPYQLYHLQIFSLIQ